MNSLYRRGVLALALAVVLPARAGGLEALQSFLHTVRSGVADFSQVVTSPARQGQAARVRNSSGTFEFVRPDRFRFSYLKPFAQTIVADGQTLWQYDEDLNQVTSRKQSAALGSTPAALIAAAPDLHALQADFALADAPERDGLQWVQATPRSRDNQIQSVRVGLRADGASPLLEVLEIRDSFGQLSVLRFAHFQVNPALAPGRFEFKPPAGADLLRQ